MAMSGPRHPNWKGGVALARKKYPKSSTGVKGFQVGHTPWNKGKPFVFTEDHKRRISEGVRRWLNSPNYVARPQSAKWYESRRLLRGKKRPPISLERRKKLSEMYKGNKSPLWRGGVSSKHMLIRSSFEYKAWRSKVLARDNYRCVWCGEKGLVEVDHIVPFSTILRQVKVVSGIDGLYEKAMQCSFLWDLSNGRTLCVPCHEKTESYPKGFKTKRLKAPVRKTQAQLL